MKIPLYPPAWSFKEHLHAYNAMISLGQLVPDRRHELETFLSEFFCKSRVVLTSSGRAAIDLALEMAKINAGDEIILPSLACPAVIYPFLRRNALPIFVDVNDHLQMDVSSVEAAITSKTKAILAPHLFGGTADLPSLEHLARKKGLPLIDDAAQSFGLMTNGKPVGSFGDFGVVSFGPGKPVSSWRGGALILPMSNVEIPFSSPMTSRFRAAKQLFYFMVTRIWRKCLPSPPPLERGLSFERLEGRYSVARLDPLSIQLAQGLLHRHHRLREERKLRAISLQEHLEKSAIFDFPFQRNSTVFTKLPAILRTTKSSLQSIKTFWTDLLVQLRTQKMEISAPYVPLHLLCSEQHIPYRAVSLDRTERLWWKIVALPVDAPLSFENLRDFADKLPRIIQTSASNAGINLLQN